jgi:hypothetical protein
VELMGNWIDKAIFVSLSLGILIIDWILFIKGITDIPVLKEIIVCLLFICAVVILSFGWTE